MLVISERSAARMRVERMPISSTAPDMSPNLQRSPTRTGPVGIDHDAADEVFDGRLRRQRDGKAADAETGEDADQRHAEFGLAP